MEDRVVVSGVPQRDIPIARLGLERDRRAVVQPDASRVAGHLRVDRNLAAFEVDKRRTIDARDELVHLRVGKALVPPVRAVEPGLADEIEVEGTLLVPNFGTIRVLHDRRLDLQSRANQRDSRRRGRRKHERVVVGGLTTVTRRLGVRTADDGRFGYQGDVGGDDRHRHRHDGNHDEDVLNLDPEKTLEHLDSPVCTRPTPNVQISIILLYQKNSSMSIYKLMLRTVHSTVTLSKKCHLVCLAVRPSGKLHFTGFIP